MEDEVIIKSWLSFSYSPSVLATIVDLFAVHTLRGLIHGRWFAAQERTNSAYDGPPLRIVRLFFKPQHNAFGARKKCARGAR